MKLYENTSELHFAIVASIRGSLAGRPYFIGSGQARDDGSKKRDPPDTRTLRTGEAIQPHLTNT
jgi:hypothetical protein